MMAMSQRMDYNYHRFQLLNRGIVNIVVIGQPQVGKTRFIRSYWEHHEPQEIDRINDVIVYLSEFTDDDEDYELFIFEVPDDPAFGEKRRRRLFRDVHAIIWMYAVDDPSSLQKLREWLTEAQRVINLEGIFSVLVGNKKDLRDDPEVMERLAEDNRTPVTVEQGLDLQHSESIRRFFEISTNTLEDVNNVFDIILSTAMEVTRFDSDNDE